jgi:hypothetical protein
VGVEDNSFTLFPELMDSASLFLTANETTTARDSPGGGASRHARHQRRASDLPGLKRGRGRRLSHLDSDGVRRLFEQESVRQEQRSVVRPRHRVRDVELHIGWRAHDARIARTRAGRGSDTAVLLPVAACAGRTALASTSVLVTPYLCRAGREGGELRPRRPRSLTGLVASDSDLALSLRMECHDGGPPVVTEGLPGAD